MLVLLMKLLNYLLMMMISCHRDNHSDKETPQHPKHAKTRRSLRNRTGCVHTCDARMNCGGLHFGNHGCGNQAGSVCGSRGGCVIGGHAHGTCAGRAHGAGHASISGHGRCCTDDGLDLEWEHVEPDNEENVDDFFQFTSAEGINVRVAVDSNSLDYLQLYLTNAIIELTVTETNTFARNCIQDNLDKVQNNYLKQWESVAVVDMKSC